MQNKQVYFASGWARYDLAQPGSFRVMPNLERIDELRADYDAMKQMIFGEAPSFDSIMDTLTKLETRINKVTTTKGTADSGDNCEHNQPDYSVKF